MITDAASLARITKLSGKELLCIQDAAKPLTPAERKAPLALVDACSASSSSPKLGSGAGGNVCWNMMRDAVSAARTLKGTSLTPEEIDEARTEAKAEFRRMAEAKGESNRLSLYRECFSREVAYRRQGFPVKRHRRDAKMEEPYVARLGMGTRDFHVAPEEVQAKVERDGWPTYDSVYTDEPFTLSDQHLTEEDALQGGQLSALIRQRYVSTLICVYVLPRSSGPLEPPGFSRPREELE